ncbi:MAG: phenylalanine--tRNA ligase subunit beta [Candidatus Zixiibacteriota bacterium]
MQVGTRWLSDYITIPWDVAELAERLTAIGTAVERMEPVFARFTGVVAARIVAVDKLPGRPDLHVLTVEDGTGRRKVVSGAPNSQLGLIVPLARPGAMLPPFPDAPVGVITFAGVDSEGACCSERDLGLSDDHSGLMDLDPEKFKIGCDLWDAMELEEVALSFELTPNRPDCLSVLGLAREIAALVGSRIRRPEFHLVETAEAASSHLSVRIEDTDGCTRYAGRLVRNGQIRPSPFWMRRRLRSAGIRSINNAVDITNFVMLETGQPLHAFDWANFKSGEVVVLSTRGNEGFITLDEAERILPANTVMITDGGRFVAIGGVMGGRDSEVADTTTSFLIESAHFNPTRIRRTRKRLDLATESAQRFERGVDPNGVPYALDRAADLFVKLTGGELLAGAVDCYPNPVNPVKLELDAESVNRFLGTGMSTPTMIDMLSGIEFGVVPGKPAVVTVPTFRPDVTREVDLTEEIARLYGYERIPIDRRAAGALPVHRAPQWMIEQRLRDLAEGVGLTEIICNSLIDPAQVLSDSQAPVALRNPLSSDMSVLRPDLYGSLLAVVAHNLNRRIDSLAVYEIGTVFSQEAPDGAFREKRQLLVALCGRRPSAGWGESAGDYDFFDLKGAVWEILTALGLSVALAPADRRPFGRGQGFVISADGKPLGEVGQIDPELCRRRDIKRPVWAGVLELEPMAAMVSESAVPQYVPLPRFPAAYRDLAIIVRDSVAVGDLLTTIRQAGGPVLESAELFDLYTGPPIAAGEKSVAFALTYRHPERTLTDHEADVAHTTIIAALATAFGARLRE